MNTRKLKGKIVERGLSVDKLANAIGIDTATMYRKLNNFEKFTIGDAHKIKDVLNLTDSEAYDIFLA